MGVFNKLTMIALLAHMMETPILSTGQRGRGGAGRGEWSAAGVAAASEWQAGGRGGWVGGEGGLEKPQSLVNC